jgi:alkanesulfonate monooxygenase SsuD/methylene tetrahydromethanopterin reductase-like flavin-dependent oxidoreductase (luciferase family)
MKLGTSLRFRVLAEGYRGTGMEHLLAGGAKSVAEQLRSYRALGFEFVMVRHIVGEHDAMLRSFQRIGQSVVPAIRNP